MRRMVALLRPHALLVGLGLLSLLVVAGAQLASPQLVRFVIDEGLVAGNSAQLATPLVLLVLAAALAGVFGYLRGYLAERVSQDVAFDLRNRLF